MEDDGGFRFTAKSKVMLTFLAYLALYGDEEKPISLSAICKAVGYSTAYIGRLLTPLREAGYIAPVNGVNGGYILKARPEDITLLDVVDTVEGSANLCACLVDPDFCEKRGDCARWEIWDRINNQVRAAFRSVTLAELTATFDSEALHEFVPARKRGRRTDKTRALPKPLFRT